ncbi:hypothetical protein [Epilithonimonas hungarica]|uniref:Uncharacterized protein n=1 Tax=Epilithonimonas hungarica TaxID=454006 RepID=A0A1G7I7Q6_9FLAO|nr:hypothetical protein [Epilithonimonas hungarica]SDF08504.1 hypothetical protein SAMN05421825_1003 [Epilithonimonas hungarica]
MKYFKQHETAIVIIIASLVIFLSIFWLSIKQNNDLENNKNLYGKNISNDSNIDLTNKVFSYISFENDKEVDGVIIQTNKEVTRHIFDFKNKIVTFKTKLNGKTIKINYPINGFYKQEGLVATTYVIEVNTLGVKEIWFSPGVPNLGYDYDDGSRIACYNLELLNEE